MAPHSTKKPIPSSRKRHVELKSVMTHENSCSQVRVCVRVRPITAMELGAGSANVLEIANDNTIQLSGRQFTYDSVFEPSTTQDDLYAKIAPLLLQSFLDGFNATIIAYGQTGSGKTYTMGSEAHSELGLKPNMGLIPRFLQDLFGALQTVEKNHVESSFLEVYGEDIHDLLDSSRAVLPLREDSDGGVICSGLTTRTISTAADAIKVLHEGTLNRTTAATLMNLTSSRSHAVFTVSLKQNKITSKLTFVDLAGSERMKKTGAEGERAREGIEINKGLLALGNVINALADDERLQNGAKKMHIPYRQSKLTRLLQDALGGNSQTIFLACVSAADTNISETLSTLHYANRARNIQNAPTRNVDPDVEDNQKWRAYITTLEAELIRLKFGKDDISSSPSGKVSMELLQQEKVVAYLSKLKALSDNVYQNNDATLLTSTSTGSKSVNCDDTLSQPQFEANVSIVENFDATLLDEVNPDEELAILDQLLELQQQDQDFIRDQKVGDIALRQVEGELVEKEHLLMQLRDSLKVYHNMKAKYESLIIEVQNLEREKIELAEQLEKVSNDPTLGCSHAIKKEMEMVERSLTRARSETRKHREMYKKAEQEAQKCHSLEITIQELKKGRATLIKKQREAASRYREITEIKTKEILVLKRKDRNAERKMSKLQSEIQIQKRNLDNRQAYCKKLMEQKKQTEAHLMKLLAMRQRNLRDRSNLDVCLGKVDATGAMQQHNEFAPSDEEVKSILFHIDKFVSESAANIELKHQYEINVSSYSDLMRQLVAAVKGIESASDDDQKELHLTIQELEIKIDRAETELDRIRNCISKLDADISDGHASSIRSMIKRKSAPVLRTVLADTVTKLSETECKRSQLASALITKESVVLSFESEVDAMANEIECLKNELGRHYSSFQASKLHTGTTKIVAVDSSDLSSQLDQLELENYLLKHISNDLIYDNENAAKALSETKDKLALAEVEHSLGHGRNESTPHSMLLSLHGLWDELGISSSSRDMFRSQIENCIENTFNNLLAEAEEVKRNTMNSISDLRHKINFMRSSLDLNLLEEPVQSKPLLEQLDDLQIHQNRLQPIFQSALSRRDAIASKLSDLSYTLGVQKESFSDDVKSMLNCIEQEKSNEIGAVSTFPINLSDDFLSSCEESISALQIQKSVILANNSNIQRKTYLLLDEMNVSASEVVNLVVKSVEQRMSVLPLWWKSETMEMVVRSITVKGGVVRSSLLFSQHLSLVYEALLSISNIRRLISNKLHSIIERAHQTLLKTVDNEFGEADVEYSNFHDALFRLPALSKEQIQFCFSEIEALSAGVDVMSDSEIESLTVVWEALNISHTIRGKFWGSIDKDTRQIVNQSSSPFDDAVPLSSIDCEEWLFAAVKKGAQNYRELESKLNKLEKIHNEVEHLRSFQDSKSKIIALDVEVRILSAKLKEFEDMKCSKSRLTTKKNTSSTLLKEERFRKQMQSKFTAKLDQLVSLLKDWKTNESSVFDADLVSEDVQTLLKNSDRNEFMHLRTVEYKNSGKRRVGTILTKTDNLAPPEKRSKLSNQCTSNAQQERQTVQPNKNTTVFTNGVAATTASNACFSTSKKINCVHTKNGPKKKLVLDPFGNILTQAHSPNVQHEKENI